MYSERSVGHVVGDTSIGTEPPGSKEPSSADDEAAAMLVKQEAAAADAAQVVEAMGTMAGGLAADEAELPTGDATARLVVAHPPDTAALAGTLGDADGAERGSGEVWVFCFLLGGVAAASSSARRRNQIVPSCPKCSVVGTLAQFFSVATAAFFFCVRHT